MRPLWFSLVVGSVVFACTIRTEVTGAPGNTSSEAGTDSAPSVPGTDASATGDAAGTFDAPAALDAAAALDASSAALEAASAADATSCLVVASDYDQTCAVDADCVNVGEVLTCPANACSFCRIETISAHAAAAYTAAFSRATAAVPIDAVACGCPDEGRPCCMAGTCQQCSALLPLGWSRHDIRQSMPDRGLVVTSP